MHFAIVSDRDRPIQAGGTFVCNDDEMGLADTIQQDLVAAMKAGDDTKKTTLRAVLTAIKTAQTAEGGSDEISDDAVMKLIATEVKQRTEAAELDAIVTQVIADGGYTTKKDMGSAIKEVMAKAGGRADGKTVSSAVGKALA